jgi:phage I-like protein
MYPNTVRRRIIPTDKAGQESAGGGETWWQKDLAKQDKEINDLRQRLDRSDKWTGEVIRRLCTAAGVAPEALDEASIEDLEQEIKDLIAYEVDQYKKCDRRNKDLTARLEKCDHHPWSYDQVCKDLDGMRQSKKELYETIAELEAEVAKVTAERDAMKADWHMDAYIKHMDSAQKEIATLKESLKIAEERNGKLLAFHELFGVKYGRQVKYEDALNEEQRIAWLAARQEKS